MRFYTPIKFDEKEWLLPFLFCIPAWFFPILFLEIFLGGLTMPNLTSKELMAIEEQLNLEQTVIKKFKLYSSACTDPQLKQKCEQISAMHQAHYNKLLNQLN
jgi:hypothetical protein